MDYERLKTEIVAISDISASVPEQFREKCFELLLNNLLRSGSINGTKEQIKEEKAKENNFESGGGTTLPKPSQIRVFMNKTGTTDDQLRKVVMFDDDEIHFLKEPAPGKVAQGQIEWALLLALKNAFEKNDLCVDPEDVRSICQEKGFYDTANFASNFKKAKNAELFRKPLEPQGEPQALSNEGQTALARVIKTLAGG